MRAEINISSIKKEHKSVGYREKYICCLIREGGITFFEGPSSKKPSNSPWIMRSRDLNLPLTDPGD